MRQGNSLRGDIRQAVKRGRVMGVQLDFSEASVQALEGMLENLHREMALPSEEQIRSEALTFGCYLGEAMLRGGLAAKGYAWDLTEGEPILNKEGGWQMAPVSKVYKRLLNGAEDNVYSFYTVGLTLDEQGR